MKSMRELEQDEISHKMKSTRELKQYEINEITVRCHQHENLNNKSMR